MRVCTDAALQKTGTAEAAVPVSFAPASLEQFDQLGGAFATVGVRDGSFFVYAGNKHVAHKVPAHQRATALERPNSVVEYGHVVFLAAGDERDFLAFGIFASDGEREDVVQDALRLARHCVPVNGEGKHPAIGCEQVIRDGVEVVVE